MTARDITRLIVPLTYTCTDDIRALAFHTAGHPETDMKKLILASASPRRHELLRQIGLDAEVILGHTDEHTDIKEPEQLVKELAQRKCLAVARYIAEESLQTAGCYVLGADTVVVHDGSVLGKPEDAAEAYRMIRSLQGDTHQVFTGVCLLLLEKGSREPVRDNTHMRLFSVCTDVSVNPMTEEEIRYYVGTEEPLDKAGAYGIQGIFARHIGGIKGEYTNVVGLPVSAVYEALRELHFFERGNRNDA